jgi:hypothetical protein
MEEIRDAASATLVAAIPGLFGYPEISSVVNLPAVVVVPRGGTYEAGMGPGVDDLYLFDLDVLCSAADDVLAQNKLDAFLTGAGPRSIRQAVYASRDQRRDAFGLLNCKARVTGWSGYRRGFEGAGVEHVGASVGLEVITSAMV